MQQLSDAKWSYVTGGVTDRGAVGLGDLDREPRLGDLVVARVVSVNAHDSLENAHGRRVRLYPGDVVVGAFGNRYATDYYEGYLPEGTVAHLLTAGGVVGWVASAHAQRDEPTELEVLGSLVDQTGRPLSMDDFAMATPAPARLELGTFVVVGSSMNSGKTTTAAALVRGWSRAGLRVGAGKVTGSGSGKDWWMYEDAGAKDVVDFLDFGMPRLPAAAVTSHDGRDPGRAGVVASYLRDMIKPVRGLSKLSITFTQGAASAERVADILARKPPRTGRSQPLPARAAGRLDLQDVVLDYGRGPVLHHLDLAIHPGERIALLGPNGAGKSTLLALIAGLYQPTRGELYLDGQRMADLPKPWLHRQIAVVLQDTYLFSGTLAENIRYARPDATPEEINRAAQTALVSDFADDLPDGLDTRLGDGGIGLSGGQRQRVGVARALLLDAPVVLLDEPTAGFDSHAEQAVVQALTRLVHGRTVVMTTHRPALTRLATRTIDILDGVIQHPADHPRPLERTLGQVPGSVR